MEYEEGCLGLELADCQYNFIKFKSIATSIALLRAMGIIDDEGEFQEGSNGI